mmetsp:Transcript_725/g.1372  ORF Transcript_725/g.1372 Transcript_725/m.1372 type:complete len:213 (+) Transcript_725:21-659(+)
MAGSAQTMSRLATLAWQLQASTPGCQTRTARQMAEKNARLRHTTAIPDLLEARSVLSAECSDVVIFGPCCDPWARPCKFLPMCLGADAAEKWASRRRRRASASRMSTSCGKRAFTIACKVRFTSGRGSWIGRRSRGQAKLLLDPRASSSFGSTADPSAPTPLPEVKSLSRHMRSNVWPQLRVTGKVKRSWQMAHVNSSHVSSLHGWQRTCWP